mmetsp:Transcript_10279/g.17509  ORF Transcript_10279/g.17509 Transcript_10279/m.17509 type:complete len:102 (+) Transcript_10279:409-714(+)
MQPNAHALVHSLHRAHRAGCTLIALWVGCMRAPSCGVAKAKAIEGGRGAPAFRHVSPGTVWQCLLTVDPSVLPSWRTLGKEKVSSDETCRQAKENHMCLWD